MADENDSTTAPPPAAAPSAPQWEDGVQIARDSAAAKFPHANDSGQEGKDSLKRGLRNESGVEGLNSLADKYTHANDGGKAGRDSLAQHGMKGPSNVTGPDWIAPNDPRVAGLTPKPKPQTDTTASAPASTVQPTVAAEPAPSPFDAAGKRRDDLFSAGIANAESKFSGPGLQPTPSLDGPSPRAGDLDTFDRGAVVARVSGAGSSERGAGSGGKSSGGSTGGSSGGASVQSSSASFFDGASVTASGGAGAGAPAMRGPASPMGGSVTRGPAQAQTGGTPQQRAGGGARGPSAQHAASPMGGSVITGGAPVTGGNVAPRSAMSRAFHAPRNSARSFHSVRTTL